MDSSSDQIRVRRFPLPVIGGGEYTPAAHTVADLLSKVAESDIGEVGDAPPALQLDLKGTGLCVH